MTPSIGCQRCARFCVEISFFKPREMIWWMVENNVGSYDSDLEEFDLAAPLDRAGMTLAVKCPSCGQEFTLTVGKGPVIDAWGHRVSTWKPILRPPARS